MALQIIFFLIFLNHLVNCNPNLEQPASNTLDRSETRTASYFNPACGPSGYKCVNQVAYKFCDRSKRILHFCQMGSVCEDTGSEICIPQPPPCIHEGGFHIPGTLFKITDFYTWSEFGILHKDFCNKFYLCIRTGGRLKQYVGACEPGFEFSIASGNCTLPLQADCSVEKAISTDVMKANRRDEQDEVPGNGNFECQSPGLYADPKSCRHYFVCARNWFPIILGGSLRVTRLKCPLMLPHFDAQKRNCWFYNESCHT
jgi:hypothetical protein